MRPSERGHVLATCGDDVVYCRILGFGNMNNCAPFQAFSHRMQEHGYREFVLDFSQCEGLDSTFLGILLGMVVGVNDARSRVVVVNAPAGVRRLLREVGIDRLLEVKPDRTAIPELPMSRLEPVETSPRDRAGMILRAHEDLCRVNPENRGKFGRFIQMLRGELEMKRSSADNGGE